MKPLWALMLAAALSVPALAAPLGLDGQIQAAGPQGPLTGTIVHSSNRQSPVALIIPGSGPTDRDGNSPLGVQASTYRLLAEGLAAHGISSVRIDKRGLFRSSTAVSDPNTVVIDDYVTDTAAWVSVIRERTGAPCVWLIGHSEGGLVALAAAQKVGNLCGLILIASSGRPMGEVIRSQLRANPANAPLIAAADRAIDALAAGQRVDATDLPQPLLPLFHPAIQGFLISTFALDPSKLAAQVQLPILIVQGGKDLQVSTLDAELLKAANPKATLEILPSANHVLKDIKGDSPAENIAAYGAADLPLAKGTIATISNFIGR
ncbi:hydrolase [Hyphomonadaceae bacterium UKL13-1]|nr:hydrolase [Hyphomonadaceae bacterium UKL13-1]